MTLFSKFPGTCSACGCKFDKGTEIEWAKGVGARHSTVRQCENAKNARAATAAVDSHTLDLKPIAEFLRAAQGRGLKSPKLRVLAPNGKSECRLGLTKNSMAPGSISVVVDGMFAGCIRPDNQTTGTLTQDVVLQKHLLVVAENPANAAKEYAALMGLCSFCGLQLTDEGSVEVGYGPICAKKWGLPHQPKGTPHLYAVR